MDLTPNDIRNHEFNTQMRGYEKDAVDEFVEQVATALESSKQENLKLSMEIDSLKSQLSGLKQFEDTIKNAAIDARQNADRTIATAKEEASVLLKKAKGEAQSTIDSISTKATDLEEKIHQLELTKKSYMKKLKSLITSHLEIIEEIAASVPVIKKENESIEVTDSSEVDTKTHETVATKPSNSQAIKSEEANAPGEIVAASPEEKKPTPSEAGLDPELAAALENYQAKSTKDSTDDNSLMGAPKPGEFTETNKLAEDIPDGFVSKVNGKKQDPASEAMEHNKIDIPNKPASEPKKNDIGSDLDDVSARLEEEIAKAERN